MKYRVGRKQNRVILDENGYKVAECLKGNEDVARQICALLNEHGLVDNLPQHLVSKFDMDKFKEYVNTYDQRKNGLDNDETIVKDMLYGIGLCLDKRKYCFAQGYRKFKTFLKAFI